MSVKKIILDDLGEVTLYKRRGVRSIKLSVTYDGNVRVTLPMWVSYRIGIDFARKNRDWIGSKQDTNQVIVDGQRVGKTHSIKFIQSDGPHLRSRIEENEIKIFLPEGIAASSMTAQNEANKASMKALRTQASNLLPMRLDELARSNNFTYKSVKVRQLKSRWGSCSSQKEITLNFFLMKLPWSLIDYVLIHELVHTKVLSHGKDFWDELRAVIPDVNEKRKEIKQYNPTIFA